MRQFFTRYTVFPVVLMLSILRIFSPPAQAQTVVVPVVMQQCDTAGFATDIQGIAYNSDDRVYAILDTVTDEVYILNSDCEIVGQFDTTVFGADTPAGITYNSDANVYAIVDSADDEIYIVDANGELIDQCNTSVFSTTPTGIAFNRDSGEYAIVDSGVDEVFIIDATLSAADCALSDQFDMASFGADSPTDIAYDHTTNQYAITDSTDDEIYFVKANGVPVVYGRFREIDRSRDIL